MQGTIPEGDSTRRFNTRRYDHAWQDGYDAYLNGCDMSANPYSYDDEKQRTDYLSWNTGYKVAMEKNGG